MPRLLIEPRPYSELQQNASVQGSRHHHEQGHRSRVWRVPNHLLDTVDPSINFTASNFCRHATSAIDSIMERNGLPIIAAKKTR